MVRSDKLFVLYAYLIIIPVFALYEDEIGKYDWTRQFVGHVHRLEFDEPVPSESRQQTHQLHQQAGSARRFFVATDHGVVAAIGLKSSRIVWRHFLEEAPINDIKLCDGALFSLSSGYLRSWNIGLGNLEYELSVQDSVGPFAGSLVCHQDADSPEDTVLFVSTPHRLYAVNPQRGSFEWIADLGASSGPEVAFFDHPHGVTLATFDPALNKKLVRVTRFAADSAKPKLAFAAPADWLASLDRCALSVNSLVCLDGAGSARLLALSHGSATGAASGEAEFQLLPPALLEQLGEASWLSVAEVGCPDAFQLTGRASVAMLNASLATAPTGERLPADSLLRYRGRVRFLLTQKKPPSSDAAAVIQLEASTATGASSISIQIARHHGPVVGIHPVTFARRGSAGGAVSFGYRVVVATRDADLHAFDDAGERQWLREESLAGIVSAEAVDLPAADQDELVTPGGSVISSFAQRIAGQAHHLFVLLSHVSSTQQQQKQPPSAAGAADFDEEAATSQSSSLGVAGRGLTRDEFNLRKLLVVATREGKLAGLDSATGRAVWRLMVPGAEPLSGGQLPLYIQRTTAHFPLEPLATVLYRDSATGLPGLMSFNPVTGTPVGQPVRLQSRLLQALLVPLPSHDDGLYLRPLLLVADTLQVTVHPPGAKPPQRLPPPAGFRSINLFTIDAEHRLLQGYHLRLQINSNSCGQQSLSLTASSTWRLALHEQVVATATRRPSEHVHSVGRVLGNRHVLYKYLNPNLLAVATQAKDLVTPAPQVGEAFTQITVWLIDTISGRVVASATHQHSTGPVSLIHSEHWVVYTLWNQKQRRFQLSVWELFVSGLGDCMNATRPLVSRQAYILPAPVQQLAVSQTERGITSKALLLALKSGGIMELNKAFLDPRRPFEMTAEFQEEGLMPYHPEVPMSTQAIINYNHSLYRVTGMLTVPTGLESTSMLFVYGTDLFCGRVQPSKMFDVLKTDFDYLFIGAVTIGMIVGSFVTQKLAARKALFRLWS